MSTILNNIVDSYEQFGSTVLNFLFIVREPDNAGLLYSLNITSYYITSHRVASRYVTLLHYIALRALRSVALHCITLQR